MTTKTKRVFTFREARRIARGQGLETREEFLEYTCAGAYKLPKNPEEVWSNEWKGWEDFLGLCPTFQEGQAISKTLAVTTEADYLALHEQKKIDEDSPAFRLPYRPDLFYKKEWKGWNDWLIGE